MTVAPVSLVTLFEDDTKGGLVNKQELKNSFIGYIINISHIHIDSICELVTECQSKSLLKNLQKTNNYNINQGFLLYEWSTDSLKKFLSPSISVLICVIDDKNNKLAGYLLLTPVNNLIQSMNSEQSQLELDQNVITDKQWEQFISSPYGHYIEQIGVAAEYYRQGIGSSLITLVKKHCTENICVRVSYAPYNNAASANMMTKNGFQFIGFENQTDCREFVPSKSFIYIWPPIKLTI